MTDNDLGQGFADTLRNRRKKEDPAPSGPISPREGNRTPETQPDTNRQFIRDLFDL